MTADNNICTFRDTLQSPLHSNETFQDQVQIVLRNIVQVYMSSRGRERSRKASQVTIFPAHMQ